ncbi:MAG TPA: ferritin-like protein [Pyrinomonadaceae bacterium]|jgi:hypothetical protein|nr:ferritin-like protein [Pyrinomonadaceae bacterium]
MIHLQRSVLAGLDASAPTPEGVQGALQSAIELEHATIPPYLYALYSLDPSDKVGGVPTNNLISEIIQSVVVEEMLHMTLASNVLNAIGGSPNIDQPGFIPTYPGPLPGGVESELTVSLAPFSSDQLATFLTIESPENPLPIAAALAADAPLTIGQFYGQIITAIRALGDGIFVKPPRNQVTPEVMYGSVVVTDVETAVRALTVIVEQGEGTSTSPEEVDGGGDGDDASFGGEYAHYYRYMQIKRGKLLVPAPGKTPPYAYAGNPVPVGNVYPVPTNPTAAGYSGAQALANNNFNYTYTSLLSSLHDFFNGEATADQFYRALGLMMSLKSQAVGMMSGDTVQGVNVGPSFEYQPNNPEPPTTDASSHQPATPAA